MMRVSHDHPQKNKLQKPFKLQKLPQSTQFPLKKKKKKREEKSTHIFKILISEKENGKFLENLQKKKNSNI